MEKYFDKNDLELIHCNKIGNQATFGKQIEILANQNDAEIVYFCEDDYFYLPNKFRAMIKFIKEKDVDFITPYDTIEYYNLKLHDYPSHVRICGNLHWRTVASTTCTFMTKRTTLLKVKKILHLYTKHKLLDLGIFLCLTKKNLFKPVKVFNTIKSQRFRARMYINVWRYGFKQILFGKKYQLWEPIPSIATHLQKTRIAPVINWPELYEKEIKELFG
ncbi:MAG TPA: glycosyltransferase family 2 protein [Candidatus Lokiarchaeia archaeon]|nr:glycosyltransferase family 2 protein [Candidatus Lokiarchaeia archaeon]